MKRVAITGSKGFIGSALAKRFSSFSTYPHKDLDILYWFGAPSSNVQFVNNMDYCFEKTIHEFLNVVQFCRDNKIKLIYPSSALAYNKSTPYGRCKAILEEIHQSYGGDILGLRIFTGYGPGEGQKGDYASVVWQFIQEVRSNHRPVIYGIGTQSRDFIYIDDIIDAILSFSDRTGLVDVGTGFYTNFNSLVSTINRVLGTNVEPFYVKAPENYIKEIHCESPVSVKWDLEKGVREICKSLPQP